MCDYTLYQGDCLKEMKNIPDKSVDLVLCDPPYGTIKDLPIYAEGEVDWDVVLPTKQMYKELLRVVRHNGKVVLFCQEPYTTELIKNADTYMQFGSKGIWYKNSFANFMSTGKTLVNTYEEFCVFRVNNMEPCSVNSEFPLLIRFVKEFGFGEFAKIMFKEGRYNSLESAKRNLYNRTSVTESSAKISFFDRKMYEFLETQIQMPYTCDEYMAKVEKIKSRMASTFNLWQGGKYKSCVFEYPTDTEKYHPTQKPVLLLEDIIKTYSNEGDMVLDFTMGSGSTGVAAVNAKRKFIGIELNEGYFDIATKRIENAKRSYIPNIFESINN